MVATVRNLTSVSATAAYFQYDGGYYVSADGGGGAAARAKAAEHKQGSAWHGAAAAALGLEAGRKVSAGTFETLLRGHVLGTDIRLGRLREGRHDHRPGFDITFSAPKSVSLAALLPTEKDPRGDRSVLRAHDEAVKATLDWIEATMLQTRGWDPATGRRPRIPGHGMAAALFRHIASRNLDPQLHTHAVVANMTRDADGRWKSIEPTLLHRNARSIGAYYRNELARRLIERGYSVSPAMAGRIPSFEIEGYDRRLRDAFSTRRKQILAFLEETGWDRGQAAAQMAALATRKRKAEPLGAMLRTIWSDRARELGGVASVARSRSRVSPSAAPSALEIVRRTMRHLEERRSVFAEGDLEALALGHSPGRRSLAEIRDAIAWMARDGHLVEAELRRADRAFVTDRALKAERATIAAMKAGIGRGEALAREEDVAARLAGAGLTEGQREAVRTVLLSTDRVVGVRGRAGTGKTTMLRHVRELAGDRPILGLAPSAVAAQTLELESGIQARTLQWLLARCRAVEDGERAIERLKKRFGGGALVLDEASMVSTDQMRDLLRIAEELDIARVALVGDRSQLRAVEAGQPFRLLQRAGMATARMDDILRQRTPALREAVLAVLAGEPGEAVELLGASVHEAEFDDLGRKAAEAWLELGPEERSRTLLVAPTHELRAEINAAVREALASEGVPRGPALRIDRLVGLGMTRAEKGDARNYREGDTVVFHQDLMHYRVKADDALAVTGVEEDRVLLLHPDGKPRRIRPDGPIRYRLEVYETRPIEIRAGDRVRWTRNDKARRLVNGGRAEVAAIGRDRVRFALADGRALSLKRDDPQLRHLDHGWSSTVHGAQGVTADGVIAVLDSGHGALADQATFYVEISRARDSAVVLTDNREQLVEALEANTGERATALEAVGEDIGPGVEALARRIPDKPPAWMPRDAAVRRFETLRREVGERAAAAGTIPFHAEGHDELLELARALSATGGPPAPIRSAVEETIAEAEAREKRRAGIAALRDETARLVEEHGELERRADAASPIALEDWPAWEARRAAAAGRWRDMLADPGAWRPHLDRFGDEAAAIPAAVERLAELTDRDEAWAALWAARLAIVERVRSEGAIPFHLEGWGAFAELARAFSEREGLPDAAATLAERVLEYDREQRDARDAIAKFIDGEKDHARRWSALAKVAGRARRDGNDPNLSMADLPEYAPLSTFAEELRWTGAAILDDANRKVHGPHLDRARNSRARIAAGLERLERHGPLDRFVETRKRLATARADAAARNILPFHDDAYRGAITDAEELARERKLETAARRRLRDARDEHAGRAAEWARVEALLRDLGSLERRGRRLESLARRGDVPLSLLAGWPGWRDANRRFSEEARSALDDGELLEHWRSRPEERERIEDAWKAALERRSVPAEDRERIAGMTRAEMARLRDPGAEHAFGLRWRGGTWLVVGDRLRLRRRDNGPEDEAAVVGTGWSGGRRPDDTVALEWLAPGHAGARTVEVIGCGELERRGARIADWSDGRLREAERERQFSDATDDFVLDARRDPVAGDLLRWTEILDAEDGDEARTGRRTRDGLPNAVRFEGRLLRRTAEETPARDRCEVDVLWRSDGGPCGERTLAFGRLTGRGCWRAFSEDERERASRGRAETREIAEQRRLLHDESPHFSKSMGIR